MVPNKCFLLWMLLSAKSLSISNLVCPLLWGCSLFGWVPFCVRQICFCKGGVWHSPPVALSAIYLFIQYTIVNVIWGHWRRQRGNGGWGRGRFCCGEWVERRKKVRSIVDEQFQFNMWKWFLPFYFQTVSVWTEMLLYQYLSVTW